MSEDLFNIGLKYDGAFSNVEKYINATKALMQTCRSIDRKMNYLGIRWLVRKEGLQLLNRDGGDDGMRLCANQVEG